MGFLKSLKNMVAPGAPMPPTPAQPVTPPPAEPDPDEIIVPELAASELIAERNNGADVVILDCRETWERQQARIPGSLHIPMNDTPARLSELPRDRTIVVVCAHGNRSYGVAGYLIANGFAAVNLSGGMAAWQTRGGEIESDYRTSAR